MFEFVWERFEMQETALEAFPRLGVVKGRCKGCESLLLLLTDVFILCAALFLGFWLHDQQRILLAPIAWGSVDSVLTDRKFVYFVFVVAILVAFGALGQYSKRRPFWEELKEEVKVLLIAGIAYGAMLFLGNVTFTRYAVVTTWILAIVFVPLGRMLAKVTLIQMGLWRHPAVIVGVGENARAAFAALNSDYLSGFDVKAFVCTDSAQMPDGAQLSIAGRTIPVVLIRGPITQILHSPDSNLQIVIAVESLVGQTELIRLIHSKSGIVHIVPALRGLPVHGTEISYFLGHELLFLTVRNNLRRKSLVLLKRSFDLCVAGLMLICLIPFFMVVMLSIGGGGAPIFYGHLRIGQGGKRFRCYKFRTMAPDADIILANLLANDPAANEEWEKSFKLRNDPRVTRIGAFLRRTSLDELPQLWNVIIGEMSLVGPRPIVAAELERYGDLVEYYLQARPGITGLWQVSGRSDTEYSYRVGMDVWYARNWSLWYDLVILGKTVQVVIRRTGAY